MTNAKLKMVTQMVTPTVTLTVALTTANHFANQKSLTAANSPTKLVKDSSNWTAVKSVKTQTSPKNVSLPTSFSTSLVSLWKIVATLVRLQQPSASRVTYKDVSHSLSANVVPKDATPVSRTRLVTTLAESKVRNLASETVSTRSWESSRKVFVS
jgi:hypothetical protein